METETEKVRGFDKPQETEKWRTIPEFPNYVISNKGRVANKNGKLMTQNRGLVKLSREGYNIKRSALNLKKQVWQKSLQ